MDSSDEEVFIVALLCEEELRLQKRKRRRLWVRDVLKSRNKDGEFVPLFKDLLNDELKFNSYFKMSYGKFSELLRIVEPYIEKHDTRFRKAVGSKERLGVCLRYLGMGESFKSLAFNYRLGDTTVHKIVHRTCEAIWEALCPIVMPPPTTEMWKTIEEEFNTKWNFPNCVGVLVGKYVVAQAPKRSGLLFSSDKIFLAIVDTNFRFVLVDLGAYYTSSNNGIFSNSVLKKSLEYGTLNFPPDKTLPGSKDLTPHVILGDEAFPLKRNLLRPYPTSQTENDELKKTFNLRLHRAREVSENALKLLAQNFQIYKKQLQLKSEHIDKIVLATCCLHNFLRDDHISLSNLDDGTQTATNAVLEKLHHVGGNSTAVARRTREKFKNYFGSPVGSSQK